MGTANTYTQPLGTAASPGTLAQSEGANVSRPINVVPHIDKMIRRVRPEDTPVTTILDRVNTGSAVKGMEWEWIEQSDIPDSVVVTTAVEAGTAATTIVVDRGDYLIKRMTLLYPKTGEQMLITNVSGTTITVERAYGENTKAQAIPAGATLIWIAQNAEEGQDAGTGVTRTPDNGKLYAQYIVWGAAASEWNAITEHVGQNEWDRRSDEAIYTFKQEREKVALLGTPVADAATSTAGASTLSGMRMNTSAGARWFCEQYNVIDCGHAVTWDTLALGLLPIFRYSRSRSIFGLGSPEAIVRMTGLPGFRERMRTSEASDVFGFELNKITVGKKELVLLAHQMMGEPGLENELLILDFKQLQRRPVRGYQLDRDIQTPGSFRKQVGLSVIEGYEYTRTRGCGKFTNLF